MNNLQSVTEHLTNLFTNPLLPNKGNSAQSEMAKRLQNDGWRVICEQPVYGLIRDGQSRPGWLDIYCTKDDVRVAIEIDRGTPKTSSIEKLDVFKADIKLAYHFLERNNNTPLPENVLAIHLPAREATLDEKSQKGYGRWAKTSNF